MRRLLTIPPGRGLEAHLRRGNNLIEFALILPVFLALVVGILEFGWFFWQKSAVVDAVRMGCREGSLYGDNEGDAIAVAEADILERLGDAALCGGTCAVSVRTDGPAPNTLLFCSVEASYVPITGLLPAAAMPGKNVASSFYRLEIQEASLR